MFAGIPCVTTSAGGIPEIAHDGITATVVRAEDPPALARAIDALLADRAEAQRLAANAYAFVATRYGLDAMLDRMELVFRRALADNASSAMLSTFGSSSRRAMVTAFSAVC